jgi:hypothetical protein
VVEDIDNHLGRSCKNEVLLQFEFLHTIKRRKAHWIGHILCRDCLQRQIIEGKIEGRIETLGIKGKSSMQLLHDINPVVVP